MALSEALPIVFVAVRMMNVLQVLTSKPSNRLQFYLSWYYDWDLKRP